MGESSNRSQISPFITWSSAGGLNIFHTEHHEVKDHDVKLKYYNLIFCKSLGENALKYISIETPKLEL